MYGILHSYVAFFLTHTVRTYYIVVRARNCAQLMGPISQGALPREKLGPPYPLDLGELHSLKPQTKMRPFYLFEDYFLLFTV